MQRKGLSKFPFVEKCSINNSNIHKFFSYLLCLHKQVISHKKRKWCLCICVVLMKRMKYTEFYERKLLWENIQSLYGYLGIFIPIWNVCLSICVSDKFHYYCFSPPRFFCFKPSSLSSFTVLPKSKVPNRLSGCIMLIVYVNHHDIIILPLLLSQPNRLLGPPPLC